MIQEKFERWINHPNIDPTLKAELQQMDEKTKKRCNLHKH